jgi:hypothetical protein
MDQELKRYDLRSKSKVNYRVCSMSRSTTAMN